MRNLLSKLRDTMPLPLKNQGMYLTCPRKHSYCLQGIWGFSIQIGEMKAAFASCLWKSHQTGTALLWPTIAAIKGCRRCILWVLFVGDWDLTILQQRRKIVEILWKTYRQQGRRKEKGFSLWRAQQVSCETRWRDACLFQTTAVCWIWLHTHWSDRGRDASLDSAAWCPAERHTSNRSAHRPPWCTFKTWRPHFILYLALCFCFTIPSRLSYSAFFPLLQPP